METTRESLIEAAILNAEDRYEIRRRLISEGFSSDGFEAVYEATLKRLGVSEPQRPVTKPVPASEVMPQYIRRRGHTTNYKETGLFVMIMIVLALALYYAAPGMKTYLMHTIDTLAEVPSASGLENTGNSSGEKYSMSESVVKAKVDATFASARIYKGKLLDYQGACTGVAVVPPVACLENTVSLVVYAPLSDGRVYCADSSGGTGSGVDTQGDIYRCK